VNNLDKSTRKYNFLNSSLNNEHTFYDLTSHLQNTKEESLKDFLDKVYRNKKKLSLNYNNQDLWDKNEEEYKQEVIKLRYKFI